MARGGRPFVANLDMYRKVPIDLLEGTRRGSILSTIAILTMATLFFLETKAYFATELATDLALDGNNEAMIRVNFNITMMDMKCDYATVDAFSALGTQQNVTQHVTKFSIDAENVRHRFKGRTLSSVDVHMFDPHVEESIEELHEDGEDAISLTTETLAEAKKEYSYLFVDFFANWCSHCRDLAPTWETFAEVMIEAAEAKVEGQIEGNGNYENHHYTEEDYNEAVQLERPVFIGKIDCVDHHDLCVENNIRAYPTLRMFVDGEYYQDYQGHRTVVELTHYVHDVEKLKKKGNDEDFKDVKDIAVERVVKTDEHERFALFLERSRGRITHTWADKDHPGCQISGFLMLDRAPGNFHIQAQSKTSEFAAHMTNVSHIVNHLSFGKPVTQKFADTGLENTPEGFYETTKPFDGKAYVTKNVHEAHHHYLKVVTTEFHAPEMALNSKGHRVDMSSTLSRLYQVLQSSQLSLYRSDIVPEAKFTYDLSPIAVSYRTKSRHWYDYLTSLMAIIGGTFTVVGMMESGLYSITSKKNR